mmetsp:Transcript_34751/g.66350  ORF Transcript_34751/g.66350 Transcript_34751/m.66350 type:complete len:571 (-) Transcript_34751:660-2372(-)
MRQALQHAHNQRAPRLPVHHLVGPENVRQAPRARLQSVAVAQRGGRQALFGARLQLERVQEVAHVQATFCSEAAQHPRLVLPLQSCLIVLEDDVALALEIKRQLQRVLAVHQHPRAALLGAPGASWQVPPVQGVGPGQLLQHRGALVFGPVRIRSHQHGHQAVAVKLEEVRGVSGAQLRDELQVPRLRRQVQRRLAEQALGGTGERALEAVLQLRARAQHRALHADAERGRQRPARRLRARGGGLGGGRRRVQGEGGARRLGERVHLAMQDPIKGGGGARAVVEVGEEEPRLDLEELDDDPGVRLHLERRDQEGLALLLRAQMLRVALRRGQQRHRHLGRDPVLDGENKEVLVLNMDLRGCLWVAFEDGEEHVYGHVLALDGRFQKQRLHHCRLGVHHQELVHARAELRGGHLGGERHVHRQVALRVPARARLREPLQQEVHHRLPRRQLLLAVLGDARGVLLAQPHVLPRAGVPLPAPVLWPGGAGGGARHVQSGAPVRHGLVQGRGEGVDEVGHVRAPGVRENRLVQRHHRSLLCGRVPLLPRARGGILGLADHGTGLGRGGRPQERR